MNQCKEKKKCLASNKLISIAVFFCFFFHSYTDRHQIQLFGRGHIGGIDIKVKVLQKIFTL